MEIFSKKPSLLILSYKKKDKLLSFWEKAICNANVQYLKKVIGKSRVKVGPKTNYFSYFMSSGTNRIAVFNNYLSLICSQPRDKQNCARYFFSFEYFVSNQLLTVFMETTLSNSSNYCYKK